MTSMGLRSRQWIVSENGSIIIGEGRKEILENIEKTGSLNKTAKVMKMSYKGVWSKIRATENSLKIKLIVADRKHGSLPLSESLDCFPQLGHLDLSSDEMSPEPVGAMNLAGFLL